jgi:prepilin-type processing-associated H-X9-DG protein
VFSGTVCNCPLVDADGLEPAWRFQDRWSVHYSMNNQVYRTWESTRGWWNWPGVRIQTLKPSRIILADGNVKSSPGFPLCFWPYFSANWNGPAEWQCLAPWPISSNNRGPNPDGKINLHSNCVNVSFADGHVESVKQLTPEMVDVPKLPP